MRWLTLLGKSVIRMLIFRSSLHLVSLRIWWRYIASVAVTLPLIRLSMFALTRRPEKLSLSRLFTNNFIKRAMFESVVAVHWQIGKPSVHLSRRGFSVAVPTIWNEFPTTFTNLSHYRYLSSIKISTHIYSKSHFHHRSSAVPRSDGWLVSPSMFFNDSVLVHFWAF